MSEAKTQPTAVDPEAFIAEIPEVRRREQAMRVLELMTEATGEKPVMWGPSIIGYGTQRFKYASGREGDWPKVAFSPRKAAISFYGLIDHPQLHGFLETLGPHTTGKGCLYVKRLADVDEGVLRELVRRSYGLANGVDA